ncbi:MAG: 3-phosphoshikimate 1-carboxyvinyltransferase, partial [Sediminibacterium sp.]|nr:3-phosphoshikimate 1-carboxyvinyltransferase [Sediminibacterium sp.]
MSSIELYPNKLNGKIVAPRSKSVMQRALACAMLHHGPTEIIYPGKSEDDLAALEIIKALGAQVTEDIRKYIITGAPTLLNQSETISIHAGESGLSMRMFTPIVALRSG